MDDPADRRAIIAHASGSGGEGVKAEMLIPDAEGRLLEGMRAIWINTPPAF